MTPIKLQLASLATLLFLAGMLFAVLFAALFYAGELSIPVMLGLTIGINLVLWLAGPYLMDFSHRFFYKIRFLSKQEFQTERPALSVFIERVTRENRIPFPKIRIIEDKAPTAYTYGSSAFNARIAFSSGLFLYLTPEELEAVIAHELGHIVHRDFIVMSIANTILQILYQLYIVLLHSRRRGNGRDKKSALALIGVVSYIFYLIGTYIILFLSRLREYYADRFAAEATKNPSALARALIKIAYGLVNLSLEETRLVESTRTLGIMGLRACQALAPARILGIAPEKIAPVMLFDLVSPWAKLLELSSTHPLTGKRLRQLERFSGEPIFGFDRAIAEAQVNKSKLYRRFWTDFLVIILPYLAGVAAIASFFLAGQGLRALFFIGALISVVGLTLLFKAVYRFPSGESQNAEVLSLMSDVYASPIRGRLVTLDGQVIGRGLPGYHFSEDMVFQDKTGIIRLDHQAGLPILGNLLFALGKLKKLFGLPSRAHGWFFRGVGQYVVLQNLQTSGEKIQGFVKVYTFLGALVVLAIGLFLLFAGKGLE